MNGGGRGKDVVGNRQLCRKLQRAQLKNKNKNKRGISKTIRDGIN